MIKRLLPIFILLVFLAHFAGFYVYFFVQMTQLKSEMRARLQKLPNEKLALFKLSDEEFKKVKVEDHEIEVNGIMYDIARLEKRAGLVYAYCLQDNKETGLLSLLDSFLKSPLRDKKSTSQVLKFSFLTFLLPGVSQSQQFQQQKNISLTFYKFSFSGYFQSLDTPPPQV